MLFHTPDDIEVAFRFCDTLVDFDYRQRSTFCTGQETNTGVIDPLKVNVPLTRTP